MKEMTQDEIMDIVCAPETTDKPEESDFITSDEIGEEKYVKNLITKELN